MASYRALSEDPIEFFRSLIGQLLTPEAEGLGARQTTKFFAKSTGDQSLFTQGRCSAIKEGHRAPASPTPLAFAYTTITRAVSAQVT